MTNRKRRTKKLKRILSLKSLFDIDHYAQRQQVKAFEKFAKDNRLYRRHWIV